MSAKGQVVIPSATRERWNFLPGSRIEVIETAAGILLKPAKPLPVKSFEAVSAAIAELNHYAGPPMAESEWPKAVAKRLREEWRSSG